MKQNLSSRFTTVLAILCTIPIIFFSSCSSSKRVTYFQDIPDSLSQPMVIKQPAFTEPRIKAGDILSISISTIDASAVGGNTQSAGPSASIKEMPTYIVDKNGNVDLPIVGRLSVVNRTISEVKDVLYEKSQKYYVNPIINIRYANFYVTILGDVLNPGTYTFANEKVNILDAIGMAGDIAITGRRDNILLVREDGDQKVFVRLNLNTADIIQSPYFYLRSGDVLQIEPIRAKINSATIDMSKERYLPYIFSGLSLLFSITNIIIQLNR